MPWAMGGIHPPKKLTSLFMVRIKKSFQKTLEYSLERFLVIYPSPLGCTSTQTNILFLLFKKAATPRTLKILDSQRKVKKTGIQRDKTKANKFYPYCKLKLMVETFEKLT